MLFSRLHTHKSLDFNASGTIINGKEVNVGVEKFSVTQHEGFKVTFLHYLGHHQGSWSLFLLKPIKNFLKALQLKDTWGN